MTLEVERKVIIYKDYTRQNPFLIFGAKCNTLHLFGND